MKTKRWLLLGTVLVSLLVGSIVSCAPVPVSPPVAPKEGPEEILPSQAIPWDEAKYHIGERATVYGAVVDTHWASGSKGKPTFLNIGRPYPDPDRFTVVIWIDYRANFPQAPEVYYLGKTVYITGLITQYEGIPEIEVKDPSQIQEQ